MSSKIGRNDPCPCGSGKKYKKCCWSAAQGEAARGVGAEQHVHEVEAERQVESTVGALLRERFRLSREKARLVQTLEEQVRDQIEGGDWDGAEEVARRMMAKLPDDPTGPKLLAQVYVARGERQVAAAHYRRAVALVDALGPGEYCDCRRAKMVEAIGQLEAEQLEAEGPSLSP